MTIEIKKIKFCAEANCKSKRIETVGRKKWVEANKYCAEHRSAYYKRFYREKWLPWYNSLSPEKKLELSMKGYKSSMRYAAKKREEKRKKRRKAIMLAKRRKIRTKRKRAEITKNRKLETKGQREKRRREGFINNS